MPKSIYVQFLSEQSNLNSHYLNRLIKILNHFISIEPEDKPKRIRVPSYRSKVMETLMD